MTTYHPNPLKDALDAQAKDFGLKLTDKTNVIILAYLQACTRKFMSILTIIAGKSHPITVDDIKKLRILSDMFLNVETKPAKRRVQSGGTSMPSEFFGLNSGAYSAYSTDGAAMAHTTSDSLARFAMNQSGGGSGEFDSLNFDNEFSTIVQDGGGSKKTSRKTKISQLSRTAFKVLLSASGCSSDNLKSDAEDALRFMIECNMLSLFTRIKTERTKITKSNRSPVKRGAPLTVAVVKSAISNSPFVIPV
jgi:hypothetical protein